MIEQGLRVTHPACGLARNLNQRIIVSLNVFSFDDLLEVANNFIDGHSPKFMVVIDDTPECDRALYYASRRAARVGVSSQAVSVLVNGDLLLEKRTLLEWVFEPVLQLKGRL